MSAPVNAEQHTARHFQFLVKGPDQNAVLEGVIAQSVDVLFPISDVRAVYAPRSSDCLVLWKRFVLVTKRKTQIHFDSLLAHLG